VYQPAPDGRGAAVAFIDALDFFVQQKVLIFVLNKNIKLLW
jgi:hypothetical protein